MRKAIKEFTKSNYSSLRSVHEMSETAYKTFEIKNGMLEPLKNLNSSLDDLNMPRQSFNNTYLPNGIIDIYRKRFILKNKLLLGKKSKAFITPFSQEIDTKDDYSYERFSITENIAFEIDSKVVHLDHGIGIYRGLKKLNNTECLIIEFDQ